MIVHLVSRQEGVITAVNHLDTIRALPSVLHVEVPLNVGDVLVRTVDIRTDAGYVLLAHDDEDVLSADYKRVLELQDSLFEVQAPVATARTTSVEASVGPADKPAGDAEVEIKTAANQQRPASPATPSRRSHKPATAQPEQLRASSYDPSTQGIAAAGVASEVAGVSPVGLAQRSALATALGVVSPLLRGKLGRVLIGAAMRLSLGYAFAVAIVLGIPLMEQYL